MKYYFKKLDQLMEFMRYLAVRSLDFNFRVERMFCVEVVEESVTKSEIEEIRQQALLNGAYV